MQVLSIAIQKGGSGKTTTTINLGAALQQMGKRVLLIDLDPQASLTQALGGPAELEHSIYDLIKSEAYGMSNENETLSWENIRLNSGPLEYLPASLDMASADLELSGQYGREYFLRSAIDQFKHHFDFILIDCPPSIGMLTVNALVASNAVILPLQAEFLPERGLKSFQGHFFKLKEKLNPEIEMLGIVLSRFDGRKKMHRAVLERLRESFAGKVFKTTISRNIALAHAQEKGVDIFHYNRSAKGALDYLQLADEVLQRLEKPRKQKK